MVTFSAPGRCFLCSWDCFPAPEHNVKNEWPILKHSCFPCERMTFPTVHSLNDSVLIFDLFIFLKRDDVNMRGGSRRATTQHRSKRGEKPTHAETHTGISAPPGVPILDLFLCVWLEHKNTLTQSHILYKSQWMWCFWISVFRRFRLYKGVSLWW